MKPLEMEELKVLHDLEKELLKAISFFSMKKANMKKEYSRKGRDSSSINLYNFRQLDKKIQMLKSMGGLVEEIKKNKYV